MSGELDVAQLKSELNDVLAELSRSKLAPELSTKLQSSLQNYGVDECSKSLYNSTSKSSHREVTNVSDSEFHDVDSPIHNTMNFSFSHDNLFEHKQENIGLSSSLHSPGLSVSYPEDNLSNKNNQCATELLHGSNISHIPGQVLDPVTGLLRRRLAEKAHGEAQLILRLKDGEAAMEQMQGQLSHAEAAVQDLRQMISDRDHQIQDMQRRIESEQSRVDDLLRDREDQMQRTVTLEAELSQWEKKHSQQQLEMRSLIAREKEMQNKLDESVVLKTQLKSRCTELSREVQTEKEDAAHRQAQITGDLQFSQQTVSRLQVELRDTRDGAVRAETDLNSMEATVKQTRSLLMQREEEMADQIRSWSRKERELEGTILAAQSNTQQEKRAGEMLVAEIRRVEKRCADLESRLTEKSAKELQLSRIASESQAKAAMMEDRLEEWRRGESQLKSHINQLENSLRNEQEKLADSNRETTFAQRKTTEEKARSASLREEIEAARIKDLENYRKIQTIDAERRLIEGKLLAQKEVESRSAASLIALEQQCETLRGQLKSSELVASDTQQKLAVERGKVHAAEQRLKEQQAAAMEEAHTHRMQTTALRAKISDENEALHQTRSRVKDLETRVVGGEKEIARQEELLGNVRQQADERDHDRLNEITALQVALQEAETQQKSMTQELVDTEDVVRVHASRIRNLKSEAEEWQRQVESLRESLVIADERTEIIRGEIEIVNKSLEEEKMKRATSDMAALTAKEAEQMARRQIEKMKLHEQQNEQCVHQLERRVEEANRLREVAEKARTSALEDLERENEKLSSMDHKLNTVKEENSQLKAQIQEKDTEDACRGDQLLASRAEVQKANKRIREIEEKLIKSRRTEDASLRELELAGMAKERVESALKEESRLRHEERSRFQLQTKLSLEKGNEMLSDAGQRAIEAETRCRELTVALVNQNASTEKISMKLNDTSEKVGQVTARALGAEHALSKLEKTLHTTETETSTLRMQEQRHREENKKLKQRIQEQEKARLKQVDKLRLSHITEQRRSAQLLEEIDEVRLAQNITNERCNNAIIKANLAEAEVVEVLNLRHNTLSKLEEFRKNNSRNYTTSVKMEDDASDDVGAIECKGDIMDSKQLKDITSEDKNTTKYINSFLEKHNSSNVDQHADDRNINKLHNQYDEFQDSDSKYGTLIIPRRR